MALIIEITTSFKKHLKRARKRKLDLDKLHKIVNLLQNEIELPKKCKDHLLKGNLKI